MHPRRVIRRIPTHSWKTLDCQYSDWLFSWLGGQLDCRRSFARAWKPEANQCGVASARPLIAEDGYVCVGIFHWGQRIPWAGGLFRRSFIHASGKDPDANIGGLLPASNTIGLNVYVAHGSRPAPPLIMPHIPPGSPVGVSQQKTSRKIKLMFGGTPPNISHPPTHKHPHSEIAL
ncbi:hypothetical protein O181_091908 [Austropuccinia psidii MF-1]|uniref:Uncharacterized protein n=1 Tax=Austropuccinia psidii MF-1 TaxID=1389203 RepID=A0A9Q3IY92_9BASI|nr:hypothetical protein [Austropuccinia psidii MF-1]